MMGHGVICLGEASWVAFGQDEESWHHLPGRGHLGSTERDKGLWRPSTIRDPLDGVLPEVDDMRRVPMGGAPRNMDAERSYSREELGSGIIGSGKNGFGHVPYLSLRRNVDIPVGQSECWGNPQPGNGNVVPEGKEGSIPSVTTLQETLDQFTGLLRQIKDLGIGVPAGFDIRPKRHSSSLTSSPVIPLVKWSTPLVQEYCLFCSLNLIKTHFTVGRNACLAPKRRHLII